MDWSRFKNIAIISFIVLNIILCVLISDKRNKSYVIQDIQIRRMQKIFEVQNVGLYANLPKEFFPKSMIKMRNIDISDNDIIKVFLDSDRSLKNYIDNEKIAYYKDGVGQLNIYKNGVIKFTNNKPQQNVTETDKNEAKSIADQFLKKITFLKTPNYHSQSYAENGGYILEYNTFYDELPIFTNHVKIFVKGKSIQSIEIYNLAVEGYTSEQKEIHSADEALVNLIYKVKGSYDSKGLEMHIMEFDLGYYVNPSSIDDYANIKAEPYYRVIINDKDIYYVNAYTNEVAK